MVGRSVANFMVSPRSPWFKPLIQKIESAGDMRTASLLRQYTGMTGNRGQRTTVTPRPAKKTRGRKAIKQ